MKMLHSITGVPNVPAVYSLYGGHGKNRYVAYIGISDTLKTRMIQHLINKDSSISTATAAVGLNADNVTEVHWWEDKVFQDKDALEAAEILAFEIMNPVLRSRARPKNRCLCLCKDKKFRNRMAKIFSSDPSGKLVLYSGHSLTHLVLEMQASIKKLNSKIESIEERLTRG